MLRKVVCGLFMTGVLVAASSNAVAGRNRVSVSQKGSLLIYSNIELRWDSSGKLKQDTFLSITNDYPEPVYVQWYFINGDVPLEAVFMGSPPVRVERAHEGWNWVDCFTRLTENESTFWQASTSDNLGCSPFTILDSGTPAGRPDTDGLTTDRVLRGYAIAWAVDNVGNEINWNHLSGSADIVNYTFRSSWQYGAYAFQAVNSTHGYQTDQIPGQLLLDGSEYDYSFDKLLLDFYATGSTAFDGPGVGVMIDTDLTLYPVDADLRQDSDGPITTKAKFDIWNENEDGFSGTERCITCWDQTLLGLWNNPNQFTIGILDTDKGKARIDGMASTVCDEYLELLGLENLEIPKLQLVESRNASLLGVANKILAFSGATPGRSDSGETLVGQGQQSARILRDIIANPDTLIDGTIGETTMSPDRLDGDGESAIGKTGVRDTTGKR